MGGILIYFYDWVSFTKCISQQLSCILSWFFSAILPREQRTPVCRELQFAENGISWKSKLCMRSFFGFQSKKHYKLMYIFKRFEDISVKIKRLLNSKCFKLDLSFLFFIPQTFHLVCKQSLGLIRTDFLPLELVTVNKCPFLFPRRLLIVGHQGGPPV